MTRRWERPLLLFSLALNVAFVSLAAVRVTRDTAWRPDEREAGAPRGRRQAVLAERWRAHRVGMLSRRLGLDDGQRGRLVAGLRHLEPDLRQARGQLHAERRRFEAALAGADHAAVQQAAAAVSRAQARLDSLSAQAMLREIEVLTPAQRAHYLRATFRPGPRSRHRLGPGWIPHHGPDAGP
jgi:Spy/CpxP family protein refolding chaperone